MASANLDARKDELESLFKKRFNRQPNLTGSYQDLALAISTWLQATHPGQYHGGFWNGEMGTDSTGLEVWGIVCVG